MTTVNIDEKSVFNAARQIGDAAARESYLQSACGDDAEALQRIGELLRVFEQAESFLEAPAGAAYSPTVSNAHITETPGTVIGPYKLLEQIGEGGFGVVFMAEQTAPVKRKVALKVIKPGMDTREVIARFDAERQALALMDHPNIARVFDAGATETGRPFFVMELVRGVSITEYCDVHQLTPRERLELFVTVCQAIQHAHQKGIIHRDIKPTNVLVTQHDDRPVVKVIDFGVAKATSGQLTDKTLFTSFAQMIGTPLYMSPEQTALSAIDVDTRSDVYSLGVLLYELLTGTTPFDKSRLQEAAFDEIRRIICEEEPQKPSTRLSGLSRSGLPNRTPGKNGVPCQTRPACRMAPTSLASIAAQRRTEPRKLSQLIRGELDWIVMKCLEKDRNRRYDTVNSLVADARRFLNNEAVEACPASAWYRFRKFARRNRAVLATVVGVSLAVLLIVSGLAISSLLIVREQGLTAAALQAETRAKDDLEQNLERERRDSYLYRIALVDRELSANNLRRALQLLDECPNDLREWEWDYLMRLCRVEPVIFQDNTEVNGLAFSADGVRLATANRDGSVEIRNSRSGRIIQTLTAHAGAVVSVAFHPDGRHLATAGRDSRAKIWDLTTDREVFNTPCDVILSNGTAYTVAFSPDGRCLAAGCDGAVQVWDWSNQELRHTLAGHGPRSISVAYSRDGRHLATGSWWGSVKLWDAEAGGEPLRTSPDTRETRHPVSALAFSPDGRLLATASFERRVDVWDRSTGRLLHVLPHSGLVLCVAFSPDGRRLASAGEDKTVHIWDAETGREVLGLRGHTGQCGCLAFSPDGRRLASASVDGTIRVWDATPLAPHEVQETLTFEEHDNEVWSVVVRPDGQLIASGGFSAPTRVWDPHSGRVNARFDGHRDIVFCLAWHPDGRLLASAGRDAEQFTVKAWDTQTQREVFTLPPGPEYFAVAFSPDSRYLVTGSASQRLQIWDAHSGALLGLLGTHNREIRGVAFSRDGKHLASASGDGIVKLWDATRLEETQEARLLFPARVPAPCLNVAFSPDSRRLATAGDENTVRIWDVQTGAELQTLRGHIGDVYTMAFSPDADGRWIASAGEDSTVKVWDSYGGGRAVRSFRGHKGLVSSVAFAPDGRRLFSGSRDHTVRVWDVTQLEQVPVQ